jgi:gliding motility-associated-like protein
VQKLIFSLVVTLSLLWPGHPLGAQISAPDFLCTQADAGDDVLNWNNNTSNCGPFEAIEIFRSDNPNGPFTLIATLTDPAAVDYRDSNPGGSLRFYFLRYRYDCPGVAVTNSDTLNNRIPLPPTVNFLSVEQGGILLDWDASPSPEVNAYIILEVTPSSVTPLDTVFNATSFLLPINPGDPPAEDRNFRLAALDPCGNDSPQGDIVSPVGLSAMGGTGCESTVTLTVDQDDLAQYGPAAALELFVSVDGGNFTSAGTFPPSATTVDFRGANDGENLCFYVSANQAVGGAMARTVQACTTIAIDQPARPFELYGIEAQPAGSLTLYFQDNQVQPTTAEVELFITNPNGQTSALPLPGVPFGSGGELTVNPAPAFAPDATFRLRMLDNCGREEITNPVRLVFLRGREVFAGQNLLTWSPLPNDLDGTLTYDLFRAEGDPGAGAGAMFSPLATGLTASDYTDDLASVGGQLCYQLRINYQPTGTGPTPGVSFLTNVVCVSPDPSVYVPNAFSPNAQRAENAIFLPQFSILPETAGYELLIYNRWGALVFFSQNPAEGWNGEYNGQLANSGTYLYVLRYLLGDGRERETSGSINLIR